MVLTVIILTLLMRLHCMSALFTVEMTSSYYTAQYGSSAILECKFPVDRKSGFQDLKVFWHKIINSSLELEVCKFFNGSEDLQMQDKHYRGRAHLLKDKLQNGSAVLQISQVKLTDTGTYRCLIDLRGADYKQGTLEVKAPYSQVQTSLKQTHTVTVLTCQSEGFPLAEVFWLDDMGLNLSVSPNTTHLLTADGLYNVTSVLQLSKDINGTYSCIFWNKELNENTSASFSVTGLEEISQSLEKSSSLIISIVLVTALTIACISALACSRRKSCMNICKRKETEEDRINDTMQHSEDMLCEPLTSTS